MLEDEVNRFLDNTNPNVADALNMLQAIRGSGIFQENPRYFGEQYSDDENRIFISRYKWFCGQRVSVKRQEADPESFLMHYSIYTIFQRKSKMKIIDHSFDIQSMPMRAYRDRFNEAYDEVEKENIE